MSITPMPPQMAKGGRFEHGSVLGGKTRSARVSSQWKSTPQLTELSETAPSGPQWLHEIKLDGFRMAARIDGGLARLLTRTGLDWTDRYPSVIAALTKVRAKAAYLDGELCGVGEDGLPSFSQMQAASDGERVRLVYYAFDLLHLDGRDTAGLPLVERKALLEPLLAGIPGLQFNGHEIGDGETIRQHACKLGFEGVVSKTIDAPYAPGNRGLWRKSKCLNRQEFVIVGWTDPEGSRPYLGALLLGYFADDGKLIYAGRVGTGMPGKVLADLRKRLEPLARKNSPLSALPPRKTRFGSPLVLSQVHWVSRGSSPRSPISPGPPISCCGRRSMSGSDQISQRRTCGGKSRGRAFPPEMLPDPQRCRRQRSPSVELERNDKARR